MITNNPRIGKYVVKNGVDKIFIDLEKLGKDTRQGHLDTWKSNHSEDDILSMRKEIKGKKILVRLNPWNNNSANEINVAIEYGADFLMLPMIIDFEEIFKFCKVVNSRVPVIPLIETKESFSFLDKIVGLEGVNEIHIGLNDLSISYGFKFIFEPLRNGMLDKAAKLLNNAKLVWGFGGIARIGYGDLPAEYLLGEHVRLNSKRVILSRSFHNNSNNLDHLISNLNFKNEIEKLSQKYKYWQEASENEIKKNQENVKELIYKINKK
tara:strand:+ start:1179 stop:1976 length:798 start_codon:yes stop_codon:yes gene_type:complete